MRPLHLLLASFSLLSLFFSGCKSEVEAYKTEPLSDYLPLAVGKYITYRLDSTVFPSAGRATEVHYYLEKNIIDGQITDNLGRPGFLVFRFLRDTGQTKPWASAGTYAITPLPNAIELYDNNQRTIPLTAPIKEGNAWKGNRYLADDPFKSLYNYTSVDNNDLSNWLYTYGSVNNELIGGKLINDVITVKHIDELQNVENNKPKLETAFASRTFSLDKYAKNIGLVYQEKIMWEYQPNLTGPSPYKTGFGIKRTLFDHN
jgi:hypothetical protein